MIDEMDMPNDNFRSQKKQEPKAPQPAPAKKKPNGSWTTQDPLKDARDPGHELGPLPEDAP